MLCRRAGVRPVLGILLTNLAPQFLDFAAQLLFGRIVHER